MRVYEIRRSLKGIVRCMVRQLDGGEKIGAPYRLRHANLHSPPGFECGYGGSGPADLAASILADFFNVGARSVRAAWRGKSFVRPDAEKVVHLHQDFKAEVIARIEIARGESHEITAQQIVEWLCKKENDEKTAAEASK